MSMDGNLVTVNIWNQTLQLATDPRLFSPRQADSGSLAMLEQVELRPDDRVLDLGCGYGLVGLAVARALTAQQVVMVDIDPLAVSLARQNAIRNGCPDIRIVTGDGPAVAAPDSFSLILCNPPYHTDFAVPRRLIEQSFQLLQDGGRLYLVVKRLVWYQKKMAGVFGGVQVRECHGYYVLWSEKRPGPIQAAAGPSIKETAKPSTRKHRKRLQEAKARKSSRNAGIKATDKTSRSGRHPGKTQ